MKKMLLFISVIISFASFSQGDSILPPYKKFPLVPPLKLLLTDSSTVFSKDNLKKNKPVLIMFFSPDCDHCKHETEEIIKNIARFKKLQIVMATTSPFDKMKIFYDHYGLSKFNNIVVGKDSYFTLPVFYSIRNFPYHALYDKKGKLITALEGSTTVEKILKAFE